MIVFCQIIFLTFLENVPSNRILKFASKHELTFNLLHCYWNFSNFKGAFMPPFMKWGLYILLYKKCFGWQMPSLSILLSAKKDHAESDLTAPLAFQAREIPYYRIKNINHYNGWEFEVRRSIVWSQKLGVQVRLPIYEHVQFRSMFEKMMFESVQWAI